MNNRAYYRITYPAREYPTLIATAGQFNVCDLSEGGLSFFHGKQFQGVVGLAIEGHIQFGKRGKEPVKGKIIRLHSDLIIVQFDDNGRLPLPRIMSEQRYLIQKVKG